MKRVNSDSAYEFIRTRILNGEYPPGYSLMTEQISAEIGISRTPVREALCKLESDGLVTIRPRLGANVKKVDVKDFKEMCDLRLALESHAAALCAMNHSDAELRDIRLALEAMRSLTLQIAASEKEKPFIEDLEREDVRFHISIMTAAKNDLMKKEILRLHLLNRWRMGALTDQMIPPPARKQDRDAERRRVQQSHEEIFEAISRRDAAAAKAKMEAHIQDIIDRNLRSIGSKSGTYTRDLTAEELVYSV